MFFFTGVRGKRTPNPLPGSSNTIPLYESVEEVPTPHSNIGMKACPAYGVPRENIEMKECPAYGISVHRERINQVNLFIQSYIKFRKEKMN